MRTYFVTGATGVVGSAVIPLLLREKNTEVCLLIRAYSAEHLEQRLGYLSKFWGYSFDQADVQNRVTAVRGDATMSHFGLEPNAYAGLTDRCTHIIHCAGNVRMNLALAEARKCSVDSARNVVAFAAACQERGKLQKVEFVSTVGVAGRNTGLMPESWITNERNFHNTYEASKAEAEGYIERQIEGGLPATVHRPSMVVGDSQSGKVIAFQVFYYLCEFLSGRWTLGVYPSMGDSRLDTIPVDYIARAIVWSSTQQATVGRILHLCSGPDQAIRLVVLLERVRWMFKVYGQRQPGRIFIPAGWFRAAIPVLGRLLPGKQRRAFLTLPIYLEYLNENQLFANDQTRALLGHAGIEIPPVDAYLREVIDYYLEHKRGA
jgi:thioester reductase-like protein